MTASRVRCCLRANGSQAARNQFNSPRACVLPSTDSSIDSAGERVQFRVRRQNGASHSGNRLNLTALTTNDSPDSSSLRAELVAAIHFCFQRGWAPGTGGNFSAVQTRSPLRLLITPSGVNKGQVTGEELLEIDATGAVLRGQGKTSAETQLHLAIVASRRAGAVMHTHSVWSTLLSRRYAAAGELTIEGYEMLKGLQGVQTHEHLEHVPILRNSQDMDALSRELTDVLTRYPDCHGILLAGHGLYTWGASLLEARRHVEIFEFLFEVVARERLCLL